MSLDFEPIKADSPSGRQKPAGGTVNRDLGVELGVDRAILLVALLASASVAEASCQMCRGQPAALPDGWGDRISSARCKCR